MMHKCRFAWLCMWVVLFGTTGIFIGSDVQLQKSQKSEQYRRDGKEYRGRHHGRRKDGDKNRAHKWKGHKERHGQGHHGKGREDGQRNQANGRAEGDWKKRWHKGHDFDRHGSHVYNKHGWFWEDETKSWYQCTPINDPNRGYGCEYKGRWYPMVKNEGRNNQAQASPLIEEIEDEEDEVEDNDDNVLSMPVVEDID